MKILLGMSGGFDSTYSAVKLLEEGHSVEGAILVMHDYTDVDSARTACEKLGIPLHVIDCKAEFDAIVKSNFVNEYKNARTPNPCIICNREIKFKYLYEYAMSHGFDRIATGHYAKIAEREIDGKKRYTLSPAADTKKDQSYMLSRLDEKILSMLIFPLANEVKEELRARVSATDMPHKAKKDSVEICFIPDNDYVSYIENKVGKFPKGSYIDSNGNVIGEHKGIIHYTVGQRKGLGVSLGKRAFVTEINNVENTVRLSENARADKKCTLSSVVYMGRDALNAGEQIRASVKVRYTKDSEPASVRCTEEGRLEIIFDSPISFVTPGQTAVVYLEGAVYASGFID